jgi:hypothetical protein
MDSILLLADEIRSLAIRHNLAVGLMEDPDDSDRSVLVIGLPKNLNIVESMELKAVFERLDPKFHFTPMEN